MFLNNDKKIVDIQGSLICVQQNNIYKKSYQNRLTRPDIIQVKRTKKFDFL